jgi:heme-degrading monooxygenase HmoA
MFARLSTYDLDEGRASEVATVFEAAIDQIRALDGFVDGYFLVERDGGRAVTLTLWDSLDTLERSSVSASRLRTEAARDAGASVSSTYEYEVTLHASAQGAGTQSTT